MLFHILILVLALCLDTFVASAAYGTNRIYLSHGQIAVFNGICCACLGISLLLGTFLDSWISETFTKGICFFSLFILGCARLFDSALRQYLKHHDFVCKNAFFCISCLRFVISIYSDPIEADADRDKKLSWKEIVYFSFAMSVDSLVTGIMAAFMKISIPITVAASFLVGELFTYFGLYLGHKLSRRLPGNLSWLSGILLILLAFSKLK